MVQNVIDWVEALIYDKIPIFNKQTTKRFWYSALISFVYIKLGYLPENTQWSWLVLKIWIYNWEERDEVLSERARVGRGPTSSPAENIDIAEIWILSNMGIIGSFIGFNQLARRGAKDDSKS